MHTHVILAPGAWEPTCRAGSAVAGPFPVDPLDPLNPLDPLDPVPSYRRLVFEQHSITFDTFSRKRGPEFQEAPKYTIYTFI